MTFLRRGSGKVTKAETRLRKALRTHHIPFKPQETVNCKNGREYTVDLLVKKWLVIEVDGSIHDTPEQQLQDRQRDKDLTESGYFVLRIRNVEVWENLKNVIEKIKRTLDEKYG